MTNDMDNFVIVHYVRYVTLLWSFADRDLSHLISNCKSWCLIVISIITTQIGYVEATRWEWRTLHALSDHLGPPDCINNGGLNRPIVQFEHIVQSCHITCSLGVHSQVQALPCTTRIVGVQRRRVIAQCPCTLLIRYTSNNIDVKTFL